MQMELMSCIKKYILIIIVFMVGTVCQASIFQDFNFKNLQTKLIYLSPPVKISDNELFFIEWKSNLAKLYKINEDRLDNLEVQLPDRRRSYLSVALDSNKVLILGGEGAYSENHNGLVFDIKNKKFSTISQPNYLYSSNDNAIVLPNGTVFLLTGGKCELYSPNLDSFEVLGVKKVLNIKSLNGKYYEKSYYTYYDHIFPNAIMMDNNKILIYEKQCSSLPLNAEVYDIKTKSFEPLAINKKFILYDNVIKLKNGNLFSINGNKDNGTAVIYNPFKNEIEIIKLPYASYGSVLAPLNNDKILILSGWLYNPDYFLGKSLVYAIYDVKNKKITNLKISHKDPYKQYLYICKDKVLILNTENNKVTIYKY